jgi:Putative abortive phage resistance protein AbiGi, antitoxin
MTLVPIDDLLNRRSDLSTFIVHLTRDAQDATASENLRAILERGVIEARTPFGWIDGIPEEQLEGAKAVCFSETPLEHIYQMFQRIPGRSVQMQPYGIAFPRSYAREKGVNPVWYVDCTPGRHWEIKHALDELRDEALASGDISGHPLMKVLPFIEQMGDWRSSGGTRKEFWWEREWRHRGDFAFTYAPAALVLCPEAEILEFSTVRMTTGGRLELPYRAIDPSWSLDRMIAHLVDA